MLKKLLLSIFIPHIACAQQNEPTFTYNKVQQLDDLRRVTQHMHRIKPLSNYFITVPPFILLTSSDIEQFLAGVPAGIENKRGKIQQISMLDHIKQTWAQVLKELYKEQTITPFAREGLIEIRAALQTAFKHDLLNSKIAESAKAFMHKSVSQNNPLIIRTITHQPIVGPKSIYPVHPQHLNTSIAQALNSYFSEETITNLLKNNELSPQLQLDLILQSMIMEDEHSMVTSGVSCAYHSDTHTPNIITVHASFGHDAGIKDTNVAHDQFYVHNEMIYPLIAQKQNRYIPDFDLQRSRLSPNKKISASTPSLDLAAIKEIAQATRALEVLYNQPICIRFIKRENTIYLVKIEMPDTTQTERPTFFDESYTKKIDPEEKARIKPLTPLHELLIIKKREKIILAPNLQTAIDLYRQRTNKDEVVVALIKEQPQSWSKEYTQAKQLPIPVIWSPDFEQLRSWINQKEWPLVFDPQQKIAFIFRRCRGFCTLYQAIKNGVATHPIIEHVSIVDTFFAPLTEQERSALKPNEFYPGVRMQHLFDLLKTAEHKTGEQALNTILFRLQQAILLEEITKKECTTNKESFDDQILTRKKDAFKAIERVAFQLQQQLAHSKRSHDLAEQLEKNFLIDVLQAMIYQEPSDHFVSTISFE